MAHPRPDRLATAVRYHEQAIAARRAHRLVVAERAGRRAVALYTAIEGPGHPDVANALIEVGQACEARDRLREARRCHRRALAILAVAVPARASVDQELGRLVVRAWMLLAGVERALGHLAAADALYRRAAMEARRRLPARDRDVVGLLNNRGMLRKWRRWPRSSASPHRTSSSAKPRRNTWSSAWSRRARAPPTECPAGRNS